MNEKLEKSQALSPETSWTQMPNPDEFLKSSPRDSGTCEQIQETVLSRLYFFPDVAYKWYKRQNAYYGNLANGEERRTFYEEDFSWNKTVSPGVYTKLRGIAYDPNGTCAWVPVEKAQDFVIEMTRLKDTRTMSDLLLSGEITTRELSGCVPLLLEATRHLKAQGHVPPEDFQISLAALYESILPDLRGQLHRAAAFLPIEEADAAVARLAKFVEQNSYFNNFPNRELSVAIDCHTDNIFVPSTGELILIDSMFPKKNWRILDELHTIARLATNVAVLGDMRKRSEIYELYGRSSDDSHVAVSLIHETRTALMQWSRRNLLGQPELAERFRVYAHNNLEELEEFRGK